MANKRKPEETKKPRTSFELSVAGGETPAPLFAYVYDRTGELVERAPVEKGKVSVGSSPEELRAGRFLIAPDVGEAPSLKRLERVGGFEPLIGLRELPEIIEIPPVIVDLWPFCLCYVKGQVVRSDGRPVCDARVHICEIDRIPWIIAKLPELEVLKLRDDLIEILRNPPFPPEPWPPDPWPEPIPGPDPVPFRSSAVISPRLNPQPEVPSGQPRAFRPSCCTSCRPPRSRWCGRRSSTTTSSSCRTSACGRGGGAGSTVTRSPSSTQEPVVGSRGSSSTTATTSRICTSGSSSTSGAGTRSCTSR